MVEEVSECYTKAFSHVKTFHHVVESSETGDFKEAHNTQCMLYYTSVRPCASATVRPSNCEVIIGSYGLGENSRVICGELDIKVLILKGKDCFVPALPLLKHTVLIAVIQFDSTSCTFRRDSQALLGLLNQKPVTVCPSDVIAVAINLNQTKPTGAAA